MCFLNHYISYISAKASKFLHATHKTHGDDYCFVQVEVITHFSSFDTLFTITCEVALNNFVIVWNIVKVACLQKYDI